jgi:hypothetical protein
MWTPEEDAILRAAYEDDAIAYPMVTAMENLPNRTIAAASMRVSVLGFPVERRRRREAAGLQLRPSGARVRKPSKYASLPVASLPTPKAAEPPALPSTSVNALLDDQLDRTARRVLRAPDPPKAAPPPKRAAPPPTAPGTCDRGDREFIRRRLVMATIPTLARELQRSPDAIARRCVSSPPSAFARRSRLGLTAEDIAGSVLGQDRGRPEVRARRASLG